MLIGKLDEDADVEDDDDGGSRIVGVRNWWRKERSTGLSRLAGVVEGLMATLKIRGWLDEDGCVGKFVAIDDEDDVIDADADAAGNMCGVVSFAGGDDVKALSIRFLLLDTVIHISMCTCHDT